MKRIIVASVAALLIALFAAPTLAVCGNARLFNAYYSPVRTPGYTPTYGTSSSVSTDMVGSFWALGSGDPVIGDGNDNGTFPAVLNVGYGYYAGWVSVPVAYGYPATIVSQWAADPGIDNCIDAAGPGGSCGNGACCMAILLSDQDDSGAGYFTYLTAPSDIFSNYFFDQTGDIDLVAIPKLNITGSSRQGASGVDVSVTLDGPGAGFYIDASCPVSITSYQVWIQEVPRPGGSPPDSRAIGDWTPIGDVTSVGTETTVNATCSGDADLYLAASLIVDDGFGTGHVGPNSTRVECGPTVADPEPRSRLPRSRTRTR